MSKVIGIDISKQTFDVSFLDKKQKWQFFQFSNDKKGFKKLEKFLDEDSIVVMEASGPYYLSLAGYLDKKSYKVSVVNPLIIKRFSQMRLNRAKTDKKDAQTIAQYGMQMREELSLWNPQSDAIYKMQQMQTIVNGYNKQLTMLKNQLGAFKSSGKLDPVVKASIEQTIRKLKKEVKKLRKKIKELADENYRQTMELLQSIPGIGPETAIALIVLTNNFENFENYKQLIAYIGFSPRIYQSGTSVKGKGHIAKMGNGKVRKLLYMCSWSAKRYNKPIATMYKRLFEKGKPERVIKVALANKLIKQAFAIVKSGRAFEQDYVRSQIS